MTGYQTIPGNTSLPELTQALSVHCRPVTSNYQYNINYPVHHLKHIPGRYPACTSEELQYSPGQSRETPLPNHCVAGLSSGAQWRDTTTARSGRSSAAWAPPRPKAAAEEPHVLWRCWETTHLLRLPTCSVWPPCTHGRGSATRETRD